MRWSTTLRKARYTGMPKYWKWQLKIGDQASQKISMGHRSCPECADSLKIFSEEIEKVKVKSNWTVNTQCKMQCTRKCKRNRSNQNNMGPKKSKYLPPSVFLLRFHENREAKNTLKEWRFWRIGYFCAFFPWASFSDDSIHVGWVPNVMVFLLFGLFTCDNQFHHNIQFWIFVVRVQWNPFDSNNLSHRWTWMT